MAVQKDQAHGGSAEGDGQKEANVPISKEIMARAQGKDEFCKQITQALSVGENMPYFLDEDFVLYYGTSEEKRQGKARIVVPNALIRQVIQQHHDPVFAGHRGEKRTQNSIRIHYFWPVLLQDIDDYIQRCTSCATMKGGSTPTAPLELPESVEPMQKTSIDICGPYPVTKRQNRYLPTFIDHFSRYPDTISIPSQDAETVARALVTQVFTRHGSPQVISSHRGTNFMLQLFQEMCKILQIKRINPTSFNPKMQGKTEKLHAGFNQPMSHYVNKYGNDWDNFVDYALMVHRSTPHTTTKYSPYYLLHRWEMRLPTTDDLSARIDTDGADSKSGNPVEDHARVLAKSLKEAYEHWT